MLTIIEDDAEVLAADAAAEQDEEIEDFDPLTASPQFEQFYE